MANRLLSRLISRIKPGTEEAAENKQAQLVFDRTTLQILNANQAAIALYGYSLDEFRVMSIREIRPVWELEKLARHISQQQLKGSNTGIWKHLKKNGDIMLVQVDATDVDFDGKSQRMVTIKDITPVQP